MKSKLDPEVYGPPESAITKELIEEEIGGFMTVEEVYIYINVSFLFIYFQSREKYTYFFGLFMDKRYLVRLIV